MTSAILLVSHVADLAQGVAALLGEVAQDVEIIQAAGLEDGGIGTSFERIQAAIDQTEADQIYAFYDLGSAKMNLEMVQEMTDKPITIYDTAFVEGAYNAAALTQAGLNQEEMEKQLKDLVVK
ncbi:MULTISPECIES: dihydroxyacetone kinase phosphoryl donor subunit DhaM [Aerococcus]|uniref:phosphoenolpyruvate--glycerone phosphotransferase n=1 Tax=Aerococcus sanguinicola TaxID=119206 RepID=A0A5N1GKL1_9LACT|nr:MULTISPECIES: dihydroxyacetone kinase phosphoryl donor subunit DhaM [Aerococcus]KAA9300828.1 PTS-dependent dihydroxyacetone kinase phosphotransferase subunit DhaM [Aerococcus sanguinicola]MDK6369383.1 dihydroxyacetone kinase phosphoryl donor subunit DhaM [Aerococcus sp. UMB9870]MDK6679884.1 dihydroxyacetone kinase phosphoryl donor subunit DhaM [Aerococcus sp. UMB8608]MDK6686755.1 dihydroxyacetone kinase phosphoryl donor subunit DhaM [Aerococcus sp. UMB8623]OFK13860.1 PTS mannnose family tra